ncbi:hypothetical protein GCM10011290_09780 [Vogesella alkaliphila]|uniref:Uncharacterized protein n=1 Tax=Vogesella alkaliphila TaxID=1193621 RepID=A0ABQ2YJH1_9NEIS|nr:hypothetical protein GCM10011290_09780 [Vogesella alkaliphila]
MCEVAEWEVDESEFDDTATAAATAAPIAAIVPTDSPAMPAVVPAAPAAAAEVVPAAEEPAAEVAAAGSAAKDWPASRPEMRTNIRDFFILKAPFLADTEY